MASDKRKIRGMNKSKLASLTRLSFLAELCQEFRITQADLALKVGYSRMGVQRWFQTDDVKFNVLLAIADAYDLKLMVEMSETLAEGVVNDLLLSYEGDSKAQAEEAESIATGAVNENEKTLIHTLSKKKEAFLKCLLFNASHGDYERVREHLRVTAHGFLYTEKNGSFLISELGAVINNGTLQPKQPLPFKIWFERIEK